MIYVHSLCVDTVGRLMDIPRSTLNLALTLTLCVTVALTPNPNLTVTLNLIITLTLIQVGFEGAVPAGRCRS